MISRIGLILCTICTICIWLCFTTPASCDVDPVAQLILTQQRLYFQSVTSVELHQVVTTTVNESLRVARGASSCVEKHEVCVAVLGNLYFSEVKLNSAITLSSAFDGVEYQARNGDTLVISRNPPNRNPYNGWTVITAPFAFALAGDIGPVSIDNLRSPELWARVLKDVVSVSKCTMLGHDGTILKFASPTKPDKTVEAFFAEDLGHLPIYVKLTFKDTISEMTVLDTKTLTTNGLDLVIPTHVSAKDYSLDGVYVQDGIIEANTESLKINQMISKDRFTIPRTNIKAINYADFDLVVPVSESQ